MSHILSKLASSMSMLMKEKQLLQDPPVLHYPHGKKPNKGNNGKEKLVVLVGVRENGKSSPRSKVLLGRTDEGFTCYDGLRDSKKFSNLLRIPYHFKKPNPPPPH